MAARKQHAIDLQNPARQFEDKIKAGFVPSPNSANMKNQLSQKVQYAKRAQEDMRQTRTTNRGQISSRSQRQSIDRSNGWNDTKKKIAAALKKSK